MALAAEPRRALLRPILIVLAVFALSGLADGALSHSAQTELRFISGLANREYYDLAEQQYDRLLADQTIPAKVKADVYYEVAYFYKRMARVRGRLRPGVKRAEASKIKEEYIAKALGKLQQTLRANPEHPKAAEVRLEVGNMLQDRGKALSAQIDAEEDAAKKNAVRQEAEKVFQEASGHFKQILTEKAKRLEAIDKEKGELNSLARDKRKDRRQELDDEEEDATNQKVRAQLGYFATVYFFTQIYDKGDPAQKAKSEELVKPLLADKGAESLPIFIWEYEKYDIGLYGRFFLGLIQQDVKQDYKKAIKEFDEIWKAGSSEFRDPLRQKAYYRKALAQLDTGEYEGARKAVDELLDEYIMLEKQDIGQAALLVKAKAYAAEGKKLKEAGKTEESNKQYEAAIKVAKRIASQKSRLTGSANVFIAECTRATGSAAGASEHFARGEDDFRQKKYPQARPSYEKVLLFKGLSNERRAECMFKIALCYYFDQKLYRAGIAFWGMAERYPGSPRLTTCVTYALRTFQEQWQETKSEFDYELLLEAKEKLAGLGADVASTRRTDPYFSAAKSKEKLKRYLEAAATYAKVNPSSGSFEESLYCIGSCFLKQYRTFDTKRKASKEGLGLLDKAIEGFNKYLDYCEKEEIFDPELIKKRKQLRPTAIFWLINMYSYPVKNDWQKVVELTEGYTTRFPEARDYFSWIWYLRLRGSYELGNREEAEKCLTQLESFPEFANLNVAFQLLANMYKKQATALEEQGKVEEAKPDYAKALGYFSRMIDIKEDQKFDIYLYVADMYFVKLGDYQNASRLYAKTLTYFGAMKKHAAQVEQTKIEDKLGKCYFERGNELAKKARATGRTPAGIALHREAVGQYRKAVSLYEKRVKHYQNLPKEHPEQNRQWAMKFELAKCLKAAGLHDRCLKVLYELRSKLEIGKDPWWECLVDICIVTSTKAWGLKDKAPQKSAEEFGKVLSLMRITYETRPHMGGEKLHPRFLGIAQKLVAAVKDEKLKKDAQALVKDLSKGQ